MSITIPGVPESITREQYTGLIRAVGMDPARVTSLRFDPKGIYAELLVEGAQPAKHAVFIRVEG